jgi:D-3-phosphoglycerate dehydrogenase / 2-oxoglutarate reductase
MSDPVVENLILDLLEWLAVRDRSYEEVMEAWRTSCPRLSVWEEANDRGLVIRANDGGRCVVKLTSAGFALVQRARPRPSLELSLNANSGKN